MRSDVSMMPTRVASYLGTVAGGVDLATAIAQLPVEALGAFAAALARRQGGNGRVFFLGNGGSYDNARMLASRCRAHGISAKVPGHPDDYLTLAQTQGYGGIYASGLALDQVGPADLVVGISGSGNSPNVIAALELAQSRGAETWCMGGRDGGAMRRICGDARALIGRNHCMEAIEDLHVVMLVVALDAISTGTPLASALARYQVAFAAFATPGTIAAISALAEGMLRGVVGGGRAFILGMGIGASHVRADLGRGATNAIPIRGITAPELFSMNSAQATANDDGLDFVLADGLVKFEPGPADIALLCQLPGTAAAIGHCRDLLRQTGTPMVEIGAEGIDLSSFSPYDQDTAVAMIGHVCGEGIRAALHDDWKARKLEVVTSFPNGQKKLGMRQTDALEQDLKRSGVLSGDEQLTFCYGALYAVRPPHVRAQRCYF